MVFSIVELYHRLTARRNGHTAIGRNGHDPDEPLVTCPRCSATANLSTIGVGVAAEEETTPDELHLNVPGYLCRQCGFEFFNSRQSAQMDEEIEAALIQV